VHTNVLKINTLSTDPFAEALKPHAIQGKTFIIFRSICGERLKDQIRHIQPWRSTFVGRWRVKQE